MVGVFIDTFVVLTLNALIIISTLYTSDGVLASGIIPDSINKTNLAQTAFSTVLGDKLGSIFVAICLLFFAFSTILSWNMFAKINVQWLFKKSGKIAIVAFTVLALMFIFLGSVASNDLVWELADLFNNLMVIPNVMALFALSGLVVHHSKDPLK